MSKFAFVDVDGTLTTGKSSWQKVHDYFEVSDKMEDHSEKFFSGKITYEQWALLDVGLWKGRPHSDLHKALNPPELIDGAREGIQKLKDSGYEVVLLSGGIDVMVDEVARQVGADAAYSNQIGHTSGLIDGTVGVMVGLKAKTINSIREMKYVDMDKSIGIGDNINDVDMFEMLGNTLAINPKTPEIESVADHVIKTDNFLEAIEYFLNHIQNGSIS